MKDINKEFRPTSWSIDSKTSIFVLTVIITLAGILSYINLPKEKFPDIVVPTIYVSTPYQGTSPTDMENLVTKPLEKQIKAIAGVKKLTSNSIQDFSNVIVEFNTDVDPAEAKQKVKDAVDKARPNLPADLPAPPNVQEIDFSEMPIMYVNLSGDFDLNKLKEYADDVKDRVESLKEITRVDVVGALSREIQINVDKFKMEAADITLGDIDRTLRSENLTMSAGRVKMDGMTRNIRIVGEFKSVEQIKNIVIRSMSGAVVHLSDIAEVVDSFKERESYARLEGKNVVTLNIVKRSGENLIEASDKIRDIVKELQETKFPEKLKITITGDQSDQTRVTLHDLINTIIIGFILVTLILMFFMGATNALFVGLSVPLSMFVAFLVMPALGFSLNMIVLFSFLLALGIVVDDAIVVIENTHRIFENGKVPIVKAAKIAAGEVFLPVFSGTMTTLAPFVPLLFWKGIIGKFMYYLPVTLIVTLLASLLVAYIINPVFAVAFMKPHKDHNEHHPVWTRGLKITTIIFVSIAVLFYLFGAFGMGNLTLFILGLLFLHNFYLEKVIFKFQNKTWPKFQERYENMLKKLLQGKKPVWLLLGTFGLLIFSFILTGIVKPKVVFFPQADPNFIYVYQTHPIGTDAAYTDSVSKVVENKVFQVIGKNNPLVESVITNVAVGAGDPREGDRSVSPHKARLTVAFVEFAKRDGESTTPYLNKIRKAITGIPGVEITVDREQGGPPTGKPISIEIAGDNLDQLVQTSQSVKKYLDSLQIPGVEELKSDLQNNNPEVVVTIDREKASREGISTGQIGMEISNAVFGKINPSKLRDENDEYPIQVRYKANQRNDIDVLLNLKITYRDMNMGGAIRQVPLSSVAKIEYSNSFGGIKRKNQKRLVTISSNVITGFNPNEVVGKIQNALKSYRMPEDITLKMGGEQEEQKETGSFLGMAMLASLGLIFLILVTQFNSVAKPIIILSEIFFSLIGVLLGFSIFNMEMSIVMTGVGIVALAGIVVRNGILLVEFTDLLKGQGMDTFSAVVEAAKTRMTPVLLTASATILGLIPLAVGLNIDFVTLFSEFNPHLFFGGESVAFWGPLSWTMIFGLAFATFLTLILVPAMYLLLDKLKMRLKRSR